MRTIKVKYVDWWQGFRPEDCIINQILKQHYNVVEVDNPDYIIASVYSKDAINYDCIRIFYTPENFVPDFNLFDYAIGFENLSYGDRYIRVPNYIMNPKYKDDIDRMLHKHEKVNMEVKTDFCSYVVSNGEGNHIRTLFFEELCKYKKVNSGGRYQNNIGIPEGVSDKYEFQKKHKFSICFENSSQPGYITEKLIQGFAAGTIPIYWGAGNVTDYFNEEAMVIVKGLSDVPNAINKVKMIDTDDLLFQKMLTSPAVQNITDIKNYYKLIEKFLINIIEQKENTARRRPNSATVNVYYRQENQQCKKRSIFPWFGRRGGDF